MSSVYKKSSSDDLFGTASFGGGGGGGGGGSRQDRINSGLSTTEWNQCLVQAGGAAVLGGMGGGPLGAIAGGGVILAVCTASALMD